MYIVMNVRTDDFIVSCQLGSLHTLKLVSENRFTFHELFIVPITYPMAVYMEIINNPGEVLSRSDSVVEFRPDHCENVYFATRAMFDSNK